MSQAPLLNIKDLAITMADERLFEGLSFSVEPGELVAVVGGNGCGKTTLLRLIVAQAAGKSYMKNNTTFGVAGNIFLSPRAATEYLPQKITADTFPDEDNNFENNAARARLERDFGVAQIGGRSDEFSGGELQKLGLARVLAAKSDLYLLDEPTNYLDIAGITALEHHLSRLKQAGRGVLIVTHDRTLTDHLADRTVLITRWGIFVTPGGAGAARALEASVFESREHRAKEISKKIEQLQKDARAKAGWSAKSEGRKTGSGSSKPHFAKLSKRMAKRAKVIERKVEKKTKELAETKPFVPKRLDLSFPRYDVRNRDVFRLENVAFGYTGEESLFADLEFAASTRDRFCLMGDNGSGKTTLMKLIQGEVKPQRGRVYTGENVGVVYVPQRLDDFFSGETLLDNFRDCGMPESAVRQYLGSVLIRRDKVHQPVQTFSRGELMRAAVTKCVLMRAEFLLLDEPTSNLDIESIEVLEKLLNDFDGGFLAISHDRAFAANICDKLYMLRGGKPELV